MTLLETLTAAQKEAMKAKDQQTLSTLRMVLAAIKNVQIDAPETLTDEQIQDVIRRQVKQLLDAKQDFEKGGRTDLIEQTEKEVAILEAYLPAQLSEDEIRNRITVILGDKKDMQMGPAVGLVMKELKGIADGATVKKIVGEILQS